MNDNKHLITVEIDEETLAASGPDAEHERRIAIFDLLEDNEFAPKGDEQGGPYRLRLERRDNRLVFDIAQEDGTPFRSFLLSMTPFRKIIKDYFLICESYYEAIRTAPLDRIEVLDMGRKAMHDDGSGLLRARLANRITLGEETSRRLFTLVCALFLRR